MRWIGPRRRTPWRTFVAGRLEVGRLAPGSYRWWITWRGWSKPVKFMIGKATIRSVGPFAVFDNTRSR